MSTGAMSWWLFTFFSQKLWMSAEFIVGKVLICMPENKWCWWTIYWGGGGMYCVGMCALFFMSDSCTQISYWSDSQWIRNLTWIAVMLLWSCLCLDFSMFKSNFILTEKNVVLKWDLEFCLCWILQICCNDRAVCVCFSQKVMQLPNTTRFLVPKISHHTAKESVGKYSIK